MICGMCTLGEEFRRVFNLAYFRKEISARNGVFANGVMGKNRGIEVISERENKERGV